VRYYSYIPFWRVCVSVGECKSKNKRGYILFQWCVPKIFLGTTDRLNYYMVIFSIVKGRLGTYMAINCIYIYYIYTTKRPLAELISTAITFGGKETRGEVKIIDV